MNNKVNDDSIVMAVLDINELPNIDPICGNCGKALSDHYPEPEQYCYDNTTGDIFTDEPHEAYVIAEILEKYPDLYEEIVDQWQKDNGHK